MKSKMIIYALSLGIGLSACEKVEQAGTSRMNVRMTDAPGDYDSILLNVAYTLMLDFDAAQSIVLTGNGKYLLKPVIRAIPQSVSGAITGIVSPGIKDSGTIVLP